MSWRDRIAAVLAGKTGGPHAGGIYTYHSSPHDFTKFDLKKLGTGEGPNLYGAGFYSAENPQISGQGGAYWRNFSQHPALSPTEQAASDLLKAHNFNREKAIAETQRNVNDWRDYLSKPMLNEADRASSQRMLDYRQQMLGLLESNNPVGPRTYELNLKVKPEQLLDWDKPLAKQSPYVQSRFGTVDDFGPEFNTVTGQQLYKRQAQFNEPLTVASERLRDMGIPGIRYLDEGSRHDPFKVRRGMTLDQQNPFTVVGPGSVSRSFADEAAATAFALAENAKIPRTSNYVMFDPNKIDIVAKYALPGMTAGGFGAAAALDQYQGGQN